MRIRLAQGGRTALALVATALVVAALLVPLPLQEERVVPWSIPFLDKLVHLALFGALAGIWLWSIGTCSTPARVWVLLASLVALGAVVEVLQAALGYRTMELGDVVADALGAAFVLRFLYRRQPARTPVDSR